MADETKRLQWSKKAKIIFIELYKKHTCLWDINHPKYHDRDSNEEAFYSMRNELIDLIPDLTIEDLKKRRKNLQTQHSAELRELRDNKKETPTLWCYDLLYFLRGEEQKVSLDISKYVNDSLNVTEYKRVFNKKLTTKLIAEYKKHSVLWNRYHSKYRDQDERQKALNSIWKSFENENVEFVDINKGIKNLRTIFSNEHRMLVHTLKRGEDWQPKSWHYNELSFLIPHYQHRPHIVSTTTSMESEEDSNEEYLLLINDDKQIIKEDSIEFTSVEIPQFNAIDLVEYEPETEPKKSEKRVHFNTTDSEDVYEPTSKYAKREENSENRRFAWLGEKLVDTLNNLQDEEIIYELVLQVEKIMDAAVADDSLELCAADLAKFKSHKCCNNGELQVSVTFDAKQKKFCEIMEAVSKLPAIQNIQLKGEALYKNCLKKCEFE